MKLCVQPVTLLGLAIKRLVKNAAFPQFRDFIGDQRPDIALWMIYAVLFMQVWEKEDCFHLSCGPVCHSPASVLLSFMEDVLHHVPLYWSLSDFPLYFCICSRYEL